ncbi:hypothetical protein J3Q64DRAFT_1729410 [Phycomyces blakesleeanus]|uniref:CASTOR ACT domain-containing protein n=2 Tax=Phycomyces blakesleeanus TaxID=4837 RepID=A0A162UM26_PHYB8|nr:hypothetical protein PHYBLDRAFT_166225 [Phycomyces blakesleeanus NRRL 1555(-)]OAD76253.1 hypothetical protein PHYBLDRAFT_166225 [Phycomyces blakesleeanus NRRL 1555(-)]|eukprot:XP_018294293.1 hypothetical protein PHYBLDRAFT_166225 [Phycomyces blakesleeanus NRRL 1555(-)]
MITILPTKVKLLHFPRSHLPHATHAIVKQLFFKQVNDPDHFFSFTENAYEISIVADKATIDNDFMPVLLETQCQDMGTSPDTFRVLQVDGEGGQDSSGRRISDLSGPLAQGKFSIFYMSTYQTDFVLIKERRLRRAVSLLQEHGFDIDDENIENSDTTTQHTQEPQLKSLRSHNGSDAAVSISVDPRISNIYPRDLFESCVLEDELRCVGLNPHYRSQYINTVLKIICYPEMILKNYNNEETRFFSYTASSDGISLVADRRILELFSDDQIFQDEDTGSSFRVIQVNLAGSNLDRCGIVRSISHPLVTEAQINLLYLSTFKSANILVSADELEKAEKILASDFEKVRDMLAEFVLESPQ